MSIYLLRTVWNVSPLGKISRNNCPLNLGTSKNAFLNIAFSFLLREILSTTKGASLQVRIISQLCKIEAHVRHFNHASYAHM